MSSLYLSILILIATGHAFPRIDDKSTKSENIEFVDPDTEKESDSAPDDRIGLNFNRGHAFAAGPQGYSGSDSNTYGMHAGIRHPGNHYTPLFSRTGGQGSSYSTGPGAPHTWANGNSHLGNGYLGGNAGAGFNGGHGIANTDSFTQQIEIPLDPFGTTLLHNLKDKKNGGITKQVPKKEKPKEV